jgi:hypothetical protein
LDAVEQLGALLERETAISVRDRARMPVCRRRLLVRVNRRDDAAPKLDKGLAIVVVIQVELVDARARSGRLRRTTDPEETVDVTRTARLPLPAVPEVHKLVDGVDKSLAERLDTLAEEVGDKNRIRIQVTAAASSTLLDGCVCWKRIIVRVRLDQAMQLWPLQIGRCQGEEERRRADGRIVKHCLELIASASPVRRSTAQLGRPAADAGRQLLELRLAELAKVGDCHLRQAAVSRHKVARVILGLCSHAHVENGVAQARVLSKASIFMLHEV